MDLEPVSTPAPPAVAPRDGWAVAAGRGLDWWKAGWRLFIAAPGVWIAITVVFFLIMVSLAFVPFLGQVASSLLYPVLGAGLLVGTRALDRGETLTIGHLFACFNEKAVPLVIVALVYFGAWFVVWAVAVLLLVGVVGFGTLASLLSGDPTEAVWGLLSTVGVGTLIVLLIAVLLGVPLVMAYWFAPALVALRGDEPLAALKSSFVACMRNMPPFLVYGVIGVVAAIAASFPFGLGWIVLMPVYAASVYASYKDIFGTE